MHNRYKMLDELGSGACGTVWRAHDSLLGVDRAIKVLGRDPYDYDGAHERFLTEARAMARLSHDHVIRVYDIGSEDGLEYMVMELADGGTLGDLIGSGVSVLRGVTWMLQVLGGLGAAHAQKLVHRDVKPSNILLTASGQAKLGDFGIALLQDHATRQTKHGIAMGTLQYMAPEQRRDARSVGVPADLHAVGATLFELVTGESPIDLAFAPIDDPRWLALPSTLRPVVQRAVALREADRHPSARALADALVRAVPAASSALSAFQAGDAHDERETVARPRPPEEDRTLALGAPAYRGPLPDISALRKVYRRFLVQHRRALDDARTSLRGGEAVSGSIRRVAHAVRGSAQMYGYPELSLLAGELEDCEDLDIPTLLNNLLSAIDLANPAGTIEDLRVVIAQPNRALGNQFAEACASFADKTEVVSSAAEVMEQLSQPAAAVVLDLLLPDRDGRQLIVDIRQLAHGATVPILVASGQVTGQIRSECLALGADDVLEAPLRPERVAAAVSTALSRHVVIEGGESRASFRKAIAAARLVNAESGEPYCLAVVSGLDSSGLQEFADQLPSASLVRPWHGGQVGVLFENTDATSAELEINLAIHRLGGNLSAGVAEPGGVEVGDALFVATRMAALAASSGPGNVAATTCEAELIKQTVVVVDDDPAIRHAVALLLRDAQVHVRGYADGATFLADRDVLDPSIVVLDLELPEMDGFAILERIRDFERWKRLPVVMLTSNADDGSVSRAFEIGADDYVIKPFSTVQLTARIQRMLRRSH